ncbi:hypothetical protein ACIQJ4_35865 [Streptomyces filamentosus]|uniref:hypothetical protein n=1 Tax=Streptomyces filamentosus TaxID=67294 RepID=UPI0037F379EB
MSRTRWSWNTRGVWIAGVALAIMLLLTLYAVLQGAGGCAKQETAAKGGASPSPSVSGTASPAPSYAQPEGWTEPDRWSALPRGKRTDGQDSPIGFPRSAEGAVAMMAAANTSRVEGEHGIVDEQLRTYHAYMGVDDQSDETAEQVELAGIEADKKLAREMGVPAGQPLSAGAYLRNTVVGYQIIEKSHSEVSAWLLISQVQKSGEMSPEKGSYLRTLVGAQWMGGDWKMTADATIRAQEATRGQGEPEMAAPGDDAFDTAGWTAIREAS